MTHYYLHHKNDPERQKKHFARIEAHWDEILKIIDEELPPTKDIAALMAYGREEEEENAV